MSIKKHNCQLSQKVECRRNFYGWVGEGIKVQEGKPVLPKILTSVRSIGRRKEQTITKK